MCKDAFKQSGSSPTKAEVDVIVEDHFSLLLFRLLSPSTPRCSKDSNGGSQKPVFWSE